VNLSSWRSRPFRWGLLRLRSAPHATREIPSHAGTHPRSAGADLVRAVFTLAVVLVVHSLLRTFNSARPAARPVAAPQTAPDQDLLDGQRPRAAGTRIRVFLRDIPQIIFLAVLVFLGLRSVAGTFWVSGASMEPNLHEGQLLGVNKLAFTHLDGTPLEGVVPSTRQGSVGYVFGGPRRGDIVVFRKRVGRNIAFVKRILGLPGDRVLIEKGTIFVNGQPLDEPYVQFPLANETYPSDGEPLEVPDGSYFVLGDNRPESSDSRDDWFVPVENLVGRAWLSYWPPATWGIVP
jgi:signal peptidase I